MRSFYIGSIATLVLAAATFTPPANAATEIVLYSSTNDENSYPTGRLVFLQGMLFGTTYGQYNGYQGTVFKLKKSNGVWKRTTILKFDGANGELPYAGVRVLNGDLYGTTVAGGASNAGTVYKMYRTGGLWRQSVIWSFGGAPDGGHPFSDLLIDKTGAIYGTASTGGANHSGAVFELTESGGSWTEKVLYSFAGGSSDGSDPLGGLQMDKAGALHGTTYYGGGLGCKGNGCGTVFELTNSGGVWKEKVLYAFSGRSDGSTPMSDLIADSKGALYGTTEHGGTHGNGVVFKLALSGGVWKETVLHRFQGSDGKTPYAGLHWSSGGSLYGTTAGGGKGCPYCGVVFELTQSGGSWAEKVLHYFHDNGSDGYYPQSSLISDSNGNLYGTTNQGGSAYGEGTVYEIRP